MTDEELDAIDARRGPSVVIRDDDALATALGYPAWFEQIRKKLRESGPDAVAQLVDVLKEPSETTPQPPVTTDVQPP